MPFYNDTDIEEQPRLDFVSQNRQRGLSQQSDMLRSTGSSGRNNLLANAMSLAGSLKGLRNAGSDTNAEMANFPGARTAPRKINEMAAYPGARTAPRTPLAQAGNSDTILGMDRFKFAQLVGGLGSAIAGDTPMGRAGAVASQFAGAQIERRDKLADIAAERQAQIAAERRKYGYEGSLQERRLGAQRELTEYEIEQERKLADLTYEREAEDREQARTLRDIQLQKYQKDIDDPNLTNVVNDDGSITFFDRQGNIVRQTEPGIGKTARSDQDKPFVPRETRNQISQNISERINTAAGFTFDDNLGVLDAQGNLADPMEVRKIRAYNQDVESRVIDVMNNQRIGSADALNIVVQEDVNKAADQLLQGVPIETVAMQYPKFLLPMIQETFKQKRQVMKPELKSTLKNTFTDTGNEAERLLPRPTEYEDYYRYQQRRKTGLERAAEQANTPPTPPPNYVPLPWMQ